AWRQIMDALRRDAASPAPSPPSGVTRVATRFTPAVEPPREEWFLAGTRAQDVVAIAKDRGIARIESPANGLIIALDPDIPRERQRVLVATRGARAAMRVVLDGQPPGTAAQELPWAPE